MKDMRNQNFRDEGLRAKLNEHEVTPPSYVWENINDRLQESKPNRRNRFFYYLFPLAACVAAALLYFTMIEPEGKTVNRNIVNDQIKAHGIPALENTEAPVQEQNISSATQDNRNPKTEIENNFKLEEKGKTGLNNGMGQSPESTAIAKSGENIQTQLPAENFVSLNNSKPAISYSKPEAIEPVALIAFQVDPIATEEVFKVASPLEKPNSPFSKKPKYDKGWCISAHYAMLPDVDLPFNAYKADNLAERSQSPSTFSAASSGKNDLFKNYLQTGILVRKRLTNSFSVGTGLSITKLNYSTKYAPVITKNSTSTTYTTTEINRTIDEKYTFGEVPLVLHYRTPGKGVAFFAEAGPSLRVTAKSSITEDVYKSIDTRRIIRETQLVYVGNSFVSYTQDTTYIENIVMSNNYENYDDQPIESHVPFLGVNVNFRGGVYLPILRNVAIEAGPMMQYSSPISEGRRVTMNFGLAGAIAYRF